jgi:hypothetical protein
MPLPVVLSRRAGATHAHPQTHTGTFKSVASGVALIEGIVRLPHRCYYYAVYDHDMYSSYYSYFATCYDTCIAVLQLSGAICMASSARCTMVLACGPHFHKYRSDGDVPK